jgi:hypothetical protein
MAKTKKHRRADYGVVIDSTPSQDPERGPAVLQWTGVTWHDVANALHVSRTTANDYIRLAIKAELLRPGQPLRQDSLGHYRSVFCLDSQWAKKLGLPNYYVEQKRHPWHEPEMKGKFRQAIFTGIKNLLDANNNIKLVVPPGGMTVTMIAAKAGLAERTVRDRIKLLRLSGQLQSLGSVKAGRHKVEVFRPHPILLASAKPKPLD